MSDFITVIQALILSLGPLGIFIGMFLESSFVPIPSEVVLVAAGAVGFNPIEVAIYGGLGSTAGGILGYYIGKFGGRPFLKKYGKYFFINEKKLEFVDNWFGRWGKYATLISRLIPLIPFKVFSISAGIAKMDIKNFAIFTLIGSIPRAFILSYFGSLLFSSKNIYLMIFVLAIFVILPLLISKLVSKKKK